MKKKIKFQLDFKQDTSKDGKILICISVFLALFGALMVYSASYYGADLRFGDKFFCLKKQLIGVVLGIIGLYFFSAVDYHFLKKIKTPILIVSIIMLSLVFVPGLGIESFGAKRWLNLGLFSFQPSEIAKIGFVIFIADYLANNYDILGTFKGILPVLLIGGIICFLIMLEPNMSITMCVALVMLSFLFIGGSKLKYFSILLGAGACAVPLMIVAEPYRLNRLFAFLDPWKNPKGEGYQLIQSLYALGHGGLLGVGLFNSHQKYLFLPFSESDFIFSIIGEEFGLIGAFFLLSVFAYMFLIIMRIGFNAKDKFGFFLSFGVGMLIIIQVLINVAVVTGSIPPTGVPLPFMSSGSTSLIVLLSAMGVLLNISKSNPSTLKKSVAISK